MDIWIVRKIKKALNDFKKNGKVYTVSFAWNKTDDLIGTWFDHESKFKNLPLTHVI